MKLNDNVIIVADLGQLKAYRVSEVARKDTAEAGEPRPKATASLSLITDIDYIAAHQKEQDMLSDKGGNFDGSSGEQHDRSRENDKRLLKSICDDIESIINRESPKGWCLAFPKGTHKQLSELLPNSVKTTLKTALSSNLTKVPKDKILSHFQ